MSFVHALKWSFLAELASKMVTPVVFIVLARLLTPEDFGVMSAAMMVIAFSQIFWEAGMGKALIQRQTDIENAANVVFWINLGLGILIAGLLFYGAKMIALTFFQDERVTAVLQVMTLQVLLGALSSVQTALLQKQMDFRKLFWVRLATVSLPGLASIPLAWNGMGYWALVTGTLTGQAVQTTMLWRMSHWRPRGTFQPGLAKEMGRFGAWVGMSGLLTWFFVWADALIVGMYLGSRELGLYQTGNQFAAMGFAILFGPVTPVLYSHLTRMRHDRDQVRRATRKVIKAITFLAIPLAMVIFSLAPPLAAILFGPKWQGIEWVIGTLALMHGFSWVVGMNGEVYRAMGKPSAETIVTTSTLAIYLATYLLSVQYGLETFVCARFGLALTALILHLLVLRAILSIPIQPIVLYLSAMVLMCGIPALFVRYFLLEYMDMPWWQLVGGGLGNIVLVAGTLFMVERNGMLREFRQMVRGSEA